MIIIIYNFLNLIILYGVNMDDQVPEIGNLNSFARASSATDWPLPHSDNGSPMKGATMLATLQKLGVAPSFSRPSVTVGRTGGQDRCESRANRSGRTGRDGHSLRVRSVLSVPASAFKWLIGQSGPGQPHQVNVGPVEVCIGRHNPQAGDGVNA